MDKLWYAEKMKEAVTIGQIYDVLREAEHDNFLPEEDLEALTDFADYLADKIGG